MFTVYFACVEFPFEDCYSMYICANPMYTLLNQLNYSDPDYHTIIYSVIYKPSKQSIYIPEINTSDKFY